ncbi:ATP-binding protein [Streptomyces sp. NPDC059783]|uniref:ATP-binding protein n=1 Tax=Streptomyces sp. NPDC059783 TaxID=3346944 RepID=UPI003657FC4D
MAGVLGAGARHLRAEWGRWWRVEDLTDTHFAHLALNEQWRMWEGVRRRHAAELKANMGLLQQQQRQATYMQMQRLQAQRRGGYQGGRGGYGGGFGMFGGGASPMVSYRMMQWAQLQIKMGQEHFQPQPVTPPVLAAARDQVRTRRHRTAGVLLLVLPAAWIGVWTLSVPVALVLAAVVGLWFTGLAYARGRNPRKRRPPIPRLLFVPPVEVKGVPSPEDAVEEPFAVREAGNNPRVAREAVRLALAREARRVAVSEVLIPEQTAYGWRVPLVLESGTAAQLTSALPSIARALRVGEGRVLSGPPDPNDAALVTLKVLTSDPFETPPPYPERSPLSCTIMSPVSLGISMEGETTPVVLGGQHVIIVSDTGGGKTSLVQAIAEYVTACRDAVVVDIDPVKRGLKTLSPLAVMTARTPEETEDVLAVLLERALARIASMPPSQDVWIPSPDAPAVIAVIEEFPQLTKRGKELAVKLLRLGREALVTIVLITQDATSDVLSDSIADAFGVRIMLPCRAADVPVVVGRADAVGQGWLPHLLVPSPEPGFPADAGRFYCLTPRHRTPVLRYVTPLPPAEADRRCRERIAAGLPRLEPLTVPASVPDDAPAIIRSLLAAFAAEGDPEALPVATIADHLVSADPTVWGRWENRDDRVAMIGRTIKSQMRAAGLTVPTTRLDGAPGRPTAYRLQDVRGALS